MTRAILWDMDGTLMDSEPAHVTAFDLSVQELGLTLPEGIHEDLLGASGDKVHQALVEHCGMTLDFAGWSALKWRHYQRLGHLILRRTPHSALAEALAAEGVPMALVSNSTAAEVEMGVSTTGLDAALKACISRADVAAGKPAPDGYLLGAERLGVAPDRCLVVEDSPVGARAGVAAGMTVLFHPQVHFASAPEGAYHLAPEADPTEVIRRFLDTGALACVPA